MPTSHPFHVYTPTSRIDNLLFNMSFFDQNKDVEEHQHSCIEIAIITGGTGEHFSGNYTHPLRRGLICITLIGGTHGMRNCNHLKHYNIACSTELLQIIGSTLLFLRGVRMIFDGKDKTVLLQMTPEEMNDVENLASRMYSIYENIPHFEEGDMRFLFALLLCLFAQAYDRGCILGKTVSERIAGMTTYIRNNLQNNLSVKDLASKLSVSPSQLTRVFQKKYGLTPIEYLLQKRLEASMDLLKNQNLSIKEIAIRCGFANGSYFSNFFRHRTGISPEAFRNNLLGNKN